MIKICKKGIAVGVVAVATLTSALLFFALPSYERYLVRQVHAAFAEAPFSVVAREVTVDLLARKIGARDVRLSIATASGEKLSVEVASLSFTGVGLRSLFGFTGVRPIVDRAELQGVICTATQFPTTAHVSIKQTVFSGFSGDVASLFTALEESLSVYGLTPSLSSFSLANLHMHDVVASVTAETAQTVNIANLDASALTLTHAGALVFDTASLLIGDDPKFAIKRFAVEGVDYPGLIAPLPVVVTGIKNISVAGLWAATQGGEALFCDAASITATTSAAMEQVTLQGGVVGLILPASLYADQLPYTLATEFGAAYDRMPLEVTGDLDMVVTLPIQSQFFTFAITTCELMVKDLLDVSYRGDLQLPSKNPGIGTALVQKGQMRAVDKGLMSVIEKVFLRRALQSGESLGEGPHTYSLALAQMSEDVRAESIKKLLHDLRDFLQGNRQLTVTFAADLPLPAVEILDYEEDNPGALNMRSACTKIATQGEH